MSKKSKANDRYAEFTLELERQGIAPAEIMARLKEKKKLDRTVQKKQTQTAMAIDAARNLIAEGRLVNTGHQMCIMVRDRHLLEAYARKIKQNGFYVMDLETTGLDPLTDEIVGICLYTPCKGEKRLYIPVGHIDLGGARIPGQMTLQEVEEVMGDVFRSARHINHNSKFDGKFIRKKLGYMLNFYWDTWLGSWLLNENEETHELKPLYAKYVERVKNWRQAEDFSSLFGSKIPFSYMPIEVATIYGADDAYKAYELYLFQSSYLNVNNPKLRDVAKLFHELEMPLIAALVDMELTGIKVDAEYAEVLRQEIEPEIEAVRARLDEFVSEHSGEVLEHGELTRLSGATASTIKLSYGSPKQLAYFIYDVLGCPPQKTGKKKKGKDGKMVEDDGRGTGEEIILKLKEREPRYRSFFEDLLRWRELDKLLGTYIIKLPRTINPATGRVHGYFNQYGAVTGRFSSSDPNLQNIPSHEKRIRKMFVASEGNVLVGLDYSQIEPRTLAYLSQDEAMIAAYAAGRDLYAAMAATVFNKTYEECGDGTEERKRIKAILLGIMYEKQPETIAKEFGKRASWGIELVSNFFNSYPSIKLFKMESVYMAETLGYVTTALGRKRRLPDMMGDRESTKYSIAFRQVVNARIQGTSADITKMAMLRIYKDLELRRLGYKMLLTVHDEIIGECPRENAKAVAIRKQQIMVEAAQAVLVGMPIKCDCEISERWYGENIRDQIFAT